MTFCMHTEGIGEVWDESKNAENKAKHGVSFKEGIYVFAGVIVTFVDARKDYSETRYITFGFLDSREILIAHTYRDECIRIISMRKCNEREKKDFRKRLRAHRQNDRSRH